MNILIKLVYLINMLSYQCFSVFQHPKMIIQKNAIFCKCSHKKRIFQGAKIGNKKGCKVLKRQNKKDRREGGQKRSRIVWCKHPVFKKEKKLKRKK